jgi:hypothetical protein
VVRGGVKIYFITGVLLVMMNAVTIREVFLLKNPTICNEGHFVEGVSAFCYLFAAITTFFRSFYRRGLEQKLTWIFSITCLLFFLRELDLEDFNVPHVLILLGTDTGRDVVFCSLYFATLVALFSSASDRAALSYGALFRSPVIRVSVVACVILVIASLLELLDWHEVEEILEMNSSILILVAAILHERVPLAGRLETLSN